MANTLVQEVTGNLWNFHKRGSWIAIPTNSVVKTNGDNVMAAIWVYNEKICHCTNHPYPCAAEPF